MEIIKYTPEQILKEKWIQFDPVNNNENELPNAAGLYIICLKSSINIPNPFNIKIQYQKFSDLRVLYIGEGCNLKKRDYKDHFKGTARKSTLRKSIGTLFKYTRKDLKDGKYCFIPEHEAKLTAWMRQSLVMYYFIIPNYEKKLINLLSAPLNLNKNKNSINLEFSKQLKKLRNTRY